MSSESSDDENLNFLKEAQDHQFLNDSMFNGKIDSCYSTKKEISQKSLRKSEVDDELQHNHYSSLKVTPEFRNHIAKHLSLLLETELEEHFDNFSSDEITRKKRKKGGVKLFTSSQKFLKLDDDCEKVQQSQSHKISKSVPLIGKRTEINAESLKEVTVEGEDILSQKETKNWSDRSKSAVFLYKKSPRGTLELIEPAFK